MTMAEIKKDTESILVAAREMENTRAVTNAKESIRGASVIGNTRAVTETVTLATREVVRDTTLARTVTRTSTPITYITGITPHTIHTVTTRREVTLNTDR